MAPCLAVAGTSVASVGSGMTVAGLGGGQAGGGHDEGSAVRNVVGRSSPSEPGDARTITPG